MQRQLVQPPYRDQKYSLMWHYIFKIGLHHYPKQKQAKYVWQINKLGSRVENW